MDENKKTFFDRHNKAMQNPSTAFALAFAPLSVDNWKQTLHEPLGKGSLGVMALGMTTGLYSLYAKDYPTAFAATHIAHPAVAWGGLAIGIAGLCGLTLIMQEKALDKLEQQPRETLDSWANKINAQRAQEKEMVRG
ncbi:MAG: hypothetical protein EAY65_03925 [Alphaproteobacteria bacterium]|nr:MAG: hypothetical protein EAY65_03925 [Alphaproteobacteria bacterium]